MSESTSIEWTDATWSPWEGCTKVGPGCDHCYAEGMNRWLHKGENWGPGAPRREYSEEHWRKPLAWNAKASAAGTRVKVFPSVCDPFDNEVAERLRVRLFQLIDATPYIDWLLLTKRIGNARAMLDRVAAIRVGHPGRRDWVPPHNVWLGATVVNQEEADRDIPKLLATPARVRFLSIEPMLGPVDLLRARSSLTQAAGAPAMQALRERSAAVGVDWVIAGGESGPGARPAHPDWFRSLRDQCAAAGVPFLFKQWGEWVPYEHSAQPPFLWSQHGHEIDGHALPDFESDDGQHQREWHCDYVEQILARRVGKKVAGRQLDGVTHDGFPEG